MELASTRIVDAPPARVWEALNDPAMLKDAIPGCESLERVSDHEWRAVVAAKVGPVSARFNGKLHLADLAPPNGYTLKFEGQGGAAGFASGEARVALAPADGGKTALTYAAKAQVGEARADRLAPDRRRRSQDGRRFLRPVRGTAGARGGHDRSGAGARPRSGGGRQPLHPLRRDRRDRGAARLARVEGRAMVTPR